MRPTSNELLVGLWMVGLQAAGFRITPSQDEVVLDAAALQYAPDLQLINSGLDAAAGSVGTFTDGPLGIGNGVILTTGSAEGALPGSTRRVNLAYSEYQWLCGGGGTGDTASYGLVFTKRSPGPASIKINYILATDTDSSSSARLVIGVNNEIAFRSFDGSYVTPAGSPFARDRNVSPLSRPDTGTSYNSSTPLLTFEANFDAQNQISLILAICEGSDALKDTALLFNIAEVGGTQAPTETPSTASIQSGDSTSTVIDLVGLTSATTAAAIGDPFLSRGPGEVLHFGHPKPTGHALWPTNVKPGASHVTTIPYDIVHPVHKDRLIHTEFCTTIFYHKCETCKEQHIPEVPLTTTTLECHRCGKHGENYAVITAPVAALETALPHSHGHEGKPAHGKPAEKGHGDPEWQEDGAALPHSHDHEGKPAHGKPAEEGHGDPEWQEDGAALPHSHDHEGEPAHGKPAEEGHGDPEWQENGAAPWQNQAGPGGSAEDPHGAPDHNDKESAAKAHNQEGGEGNPNTQGSSESGKQGDPGQASGPDGANEAAQPGDQEGSNKAGSPVGPNNPGAGPNGGPIPHGSGPVVVSAGYGAVDTLCVTLLLVLGTMPMFL